MNDIVTNAIDRNCIVTGDCKNTDYSKMQNCINDLRLYNDMMADKSYYQRVEELQELRKENKQLKQQQKEFIEWLVKMSKDLFQNEEYGSSAIYGYILSKYKEIIGCKE